MNMVTRNSLESQTSLSELFAGLSAEGRYGHLKIFLSRNNDKHELPMHFLWISRNAFGKVLLDDVDFDGTQIQLSLQDCKTGFKKVVTMDINDKGFQFLMISWDDIRTMVLADKKSILNNEELLDFE
jgi:hypothetical protein